MAIPPPNPTSSPTHQPSIISHYTASPSEVSLNRRWYNRINTWTYGIGPGTVVGTVAGTQSVVSRRRGTRGVEEETLVPGESVSQAGVGLMKSGRKVDGVVINPNLIPSSIPPPPPPPPPPRPARRPAPQSHNHPPNRHPINQPPHHPVTSSDVPPLLPLSKSHGSLHSVVHTIYPRESISVRESPSSFIGREMDDTIDLDGHDGDHHAQRLSIPTSHSHHIPDETRSKGLSTAELKALRGNMLDDGVGSHSPVPSRRPSMTTLRPALRPTTSKNHLNVHDSINRHVPDPPKTNTSSQVPPRSMTPTSAVDSEKAIKQSNNAIKIEDRHSRGSKRTSVVILDPILSRVPRKRYPEPETVIMISKPPSSAVVQPMSARARHSTTLANSTTNPHAIPLPPSVISDVSTATVNRALLTGPFTERRTEHLGMRPVSKSATIQIPRDQISPVSSKEKLDSAPLRVREKSTTQVLSARTVKSAVRPQEIPPTPSTLVSQQASTQPPSIQNSHRSNFQRDRSLDRSLPPLPDSVESDSRQGEEAKQYHRPGVAHVSAPPTNANLTGLARARSLLMPKPRIRVAGTQAPIDMTNYADIPSLEDERDTALLRSATLPSRPPLARNTPFRQPALRPIPRQAPSARTFEESLLSLASTTFEPAVAQKYTYAQPESRQWAYGAAPRQKPSMWKRISEVFREPDVQYRRPPPQQRLNVVDDLAKNPSLRPFLRRNDQDSEMRRHPSLQNRRNVGMDADGEWIDDDEDMPVPPQLAQQMRQRQPPPKLVRPWRRDAPPLQQRPSVFTRQPTPPSAMQEDQLRDPYESRYDDSPALSPYGDPMDSPLTLPSQQRGTMNQPPPPPPLGFFGGRPRPRQSLPPHPMPSALRLPISLPELSPHSRLQPDHDDDYEDYDSFPQPRMGPRAGQMPTNISRPTTTRGEYGPGPYPSQLRPTWNQQLGLPRPQVGAWKAQPPKQGSGRIGRPVPGFPHDETEYELSPPQNNQRSTRRPRQPPRLQSLPKNNRRPPAEIGRLFGRSRPRDDEYGRRPRTRRPMSMYGLSGMRSRQAYREPRPRDAYGGRTLSAPLYDKPNVGFPRTRRRDTKRNRTGVNRAPKWSEQYSKYRRRPDRNNQPRNKTTRQRYGFSGLPRSGLGGMNQPINTQARRSTTNARARVRTNRTEQSKTSTQQQGRKVMGRAEGMSWGTRMKDWLTR